VKHVLESHGCCDSFRKSKHLPHPSALPIGLCILPNTCPELFVQMYHVHVCCITNQPTVEAETPTPYEAQLAHPYLPQDIAPDTWRALVFFAFLGTKSVDGGDLPRFGADGPFQAEWDLERGPQRLSCKPLNTRGP
jgi:hypothetical protein